MDSIGNWYCSDNNMKKLVKFDFAARCKGFLDDFVRASTFAPFFIKRIATF